MYQKFLYAELTRLKKETQSLKQLAELEAKELQQIFPSKKRLLS